MFRTTERCSTPTDASSAAGHYNVSLPDDHPGASDPDYRTRRDAIARVPDGVYDNSVTMDGYDQPVTIEVTVTVTDGEEALERATEIRPDLVLLDVMMPRLDGFEVAQRLRKNPQTANTSIIMLTAKALSSDKVTGLQSGADDYIIKPFDPIELLARVKGTLRRAKEMRNLSPLTGLPGNIRIQEEIERQVRETTQAASDDPAARARRGG